jgi:hypothetical protein
VGPDPEALVGELHSFLVPMGWAIIHSFIHSFIHNLCAI